MLETSNLARKYALICSSRKYTFWQLGHLIFADVSIFLQKKKAFFSKKYLYSKQQCESCVRGFIVLFSVFVRQKVPVTENIRFADFVSGIQSLDRSKLAKKTDNDMTSNFFDVALFSYWSKLHVNIITRFGIMTIFFYKGLTRNSEMGNTPI